MITPRFRLDQDEKTVSIFIRAPHCSIKDLDVSLEEDIFLFSCKPYYLRLHLPGKLEERNAHSSFNSDKGVFTFQYNKCTRGEHFPDLHFITTLLCPKLVVESGNRKIEVLTSEEGKIVEENENIKDDVQYGFAMRGGYDFKVLSTEFSEVFEVDPHEVAFEDRHKLRQEKEQAQFNADHYIADLLDNGEILSLMELDVPWKDFTEADLQFTTDELDFLKDLPNVDYKLSLEQIKYCHNSLIEILYAYCYDCRTTCFESTCESAWTISKISASLCWFDSFLSPKQALICAFRRSLMYPLYREFNLCQQILKDLLTLIQLGEQFIIKSLIKVYDLFLLSSSGRYVLNNLFIKDYIVYIMKWDKDLWLKSVEELKTVVIEKNDLGLNLLQLENSANSEDDLIATMETLQINEESDSDDTSASSSSSSDESEN